MVASNTGNRQCDRIGCLAGKKIEVYFTSAEASDKVALTCGPAAWGRSSGWPAWRPEGVCAGAELCDPLQPGHHCQGGPGFAVFHPRPGSGFLGLHVTLARPCEVQALLYCMGLRRLGKGWAAVPGTLFSSIQVCVSLQGREVIGALHSGLPQVLALLRTSACARSAE